MIKLNRLCCVFICGAFWGVAWAQSPLIEVSPKELCAAVAAEGQDACVAQMDNLRAILNEQWPAFSQCAAKVNLSEAKSSALFPCLTDEMQGKIKAQMRDDVALPEGESPTIPANGLFFTVAEVCSSVKGAENAACQKGLADIQAVLGQVLWAEFAACGVKQNLQSGGESLMLCLSPDMTNKLMEAARAKSPSP